MDKAPHLSFDDALERVAKVLKATKDEVRKAIEGFYSRTLGKVPKEPDPSREICTEIILRPEIRKPLLSGESVSLSMKGRLPIEIGRTRWRELDKETKEMVDAGKIVARRLDLKLDGWPAPSCPRSPIRSQRR